MGYYPCKNPIALLLCLPSRQVLSWKDIGVGCSSSRRTRAKDLFSSSDGLLLHCCPRSTTQMGPACSRNGSVWGFLVIRKTKGSLEREMGGICTHLFHSSLCSLYHFSFSRRTVMFPEYGRWNRLHHSTSIALVMPGPSLTKASDEQVGKEEVAKQGKLTCA